LKRLIPKQKKV